jgi:hypothetical protein
MKKVYESPYQVIFWHQTESLIENCWLPTTQKLDDNTFKQELLALIKIIQEFNPRKQLVNSQQLAYEIPKNLQAWTDLHITKKTLEKGVERISLVSAKNKRVKISVEETLEEEYGLKADVVFFEDVSQAKNWLNKY